MLSLQEVGGETVSDREARRHGQDMLAALGELQRALLAGGGDAEALQRWRIWPLQCRGRPIHGWRPWFRRSWSGRGWSWRDGSV